MAMEQEAMIKDNKGHSPCWLEIIRNERYAKHNVLANFQP
jgi:hypothetical protein